jgi:hypothetical protein
LSHDLREDFDSSVDIGGRDVQVGNGADGFGARADYQHSKLLERGGQRGGVVWFGGSVLMASVS